MEEEEETVGGAPKPKKLSVGAIVAVVIISAIVIVLIAVGVWLSVSFSGDIKIDDQKGSQVADENNFPGFPPNFEEQLKQAFQPCLITIDGKTVAPDLGSPSPIVQAFKVLEFGLQVCSQRKFTVDRSVSGTGKVLTFGFTTLEITVSMETVCTGTSSKNGEIRSNVASIHGILTLDIQPVQSFGKATVKQQTKICFYDGASVDGCAFGTFRSLVHDRETNVLSYIFIETSKGSTACRTFLSFYESRALVEPFTLWTIPRGLLNVSVLVMRRYLITPIPSAELFYRSELTDEFVVIVKCRTSQNLCS